MLIDKDTLVLLRLPFSLLLMPIFLLALSQIEAAYTWQDVLWPFLLIHLLVYPASNGYNSYVDRDEHSIGGLERPPMPTVRLFYLTLVMDAAAVLLAVLLVSVAFAGALLIYILVSRAYSARQVRLKKYAVLGFLVVVVFQGGFTYYLTYLGVTQSFLPLEGAVPWVLVACTLQIGGVYPLTQVYQHKQDLADGVVTLSYKLGYRGTFVFAALMFASCNFCYFMYFTAVGRLDSFFVLQAFFAPILAFFAYWFVQVWRSSSEANFRNTMLMNLIAAICMNLCFAILWLGS